MIQASVIQSVICTTDSEAAPAGVTTPTGAVTSPSYFAALGLRPKRNRKIRFGLLCPDTAAFYCHQVAAFVRAKHMPTAILKVL